MGWSGPSPNAEGRMVGYAVNATCDFEGCDEKIDRGLAYVCGGMHDGGEFGCGRYFCHAHGGGHLCEECSDNARCPTCEGSGMLDDDEGIECEECNGTGERELQW